jgi:hypothetical protein
LRALCLLLAAGALSVPAFADELVVGNATSKLITKLMVPVSGASPDTDVLNPGQTIEPNKTLSLEFNPKTDGCVFDVWAMFDDDTIRMIEAYNACEVTDVNDQDQWAVFGE